MSEDPAPFIKVERPDPELDHHLGCSPPIPDTTETPAAKKYRPGPASKKKTRSQQPKQGSDTEEVKVKPEPRHSFNNSSDGDNDFEETSSFQTKKKKRWVAPKVHVNYTEAQTCTFCGTVCETWKKYIAHVEGNHQDKLLERKRLRGDSKMFKFKIEPSILDLVLNNEKKHLCEECGKAFLKKSKLQKHVRVQHLGIAYICHICSKKVSDERTLEMHIENTHLKTLEERERKFQCQECPQNFLQMCHLTRHFQTKHRGIKRFKCDHCEKMFYEKGDLKRHTNETHLQIRDYECNLCDKKFTKSTNLKAHVDIVHHKLRKFICEYCQEKFATKRNLQNHIGLRHRC